LKTIGILGGLSPESTIAYYEYITREYVKRFGDYSYPEIIIYSVSFQEFMNWQKQGNWETASKKMIQAMDKLAAAGADFGIIATNTMHIVFDKVSKGTKLPLISIVDSTVEAIKKEGLRKIGLLGTVFTMKEGFFKDNLARLGIEVLVPPEEDQLEINDIIFGELCRGKFLRESKHKFMQVIDRLAAEGAEGIICGCTEIPLLISQEDCGLKLFNTTTIHAQKALDFALNS